MHDTKADLAVRTTVSPMPVFATSTWQVFFFGTNVRIRWDLLWPFIQLRHILTRQDFLRSLEWIQFNRDEQCSTKLVESNGKNSIAINPYP